MNFTNKLKYDDFTAFRTFWQVDKISQKMFGDKEKIGFLADLFYLNFFLIMNIDKKHKNSYHQKICEYFLPAYYIHLRR